MKINREWLKHIFFSLTEHGAIRVLDAVFTISLIRILGPVDFGLFSVFQSWVAIALFFLPHIELSIFREYGGLKSRGELGKQLYTFKIYNTWKIIFAILASFLLAFGNDSSSYSARFMLLLLSFALPLSHSIYGYLRDPLRFEMKQHLVAFVGAFQRILLILAIYISATLWPANSTAICFGAILIYLAAWYMWKRASVIPVEKTPLPETIERIKSQLKGTTLWIHLNGLIFTSIQTLDIFMLNSRGANIEEIGRYSISMKTANFFQMLPLAIVSSFGVYLGRNQHNQNPKKETNALLLMCGLFVVMSLVLFPLGMHFAEPLLVFIGNNKIPASQINVTIEYFQYQLIGVFILCFTHPITTYLGARVSLKRINLMVMLPWMAFTYFVYWNSSMNFLDTAKANILVYSGMLVLLLILIFFERKSPSNG